MKVNIAIEDYCAESFNLMRESVGLYFSKAPFINAFSVAYIHHATFK
jgi:hypothetical protein